MKLGNAAFAAFVVCALAVAPARADLPVETGIASFYGKNDGFHGKKTANGEIYDRETLTAAHRTAPFGSLLKVTNLSNGKSVVVRVNNRGPFTRGRVVDLSFRAARDLGFVSRGLTRVKVERLGAGASAGS